MTSITRAADSIFQTVPAKDVDQVMELIESLVLNQAHQPDVWNEIAQSVLDMTFETQEEEEEEEEEEHNSGHGRVFLKTPLNRLGGRYRSPFSHKLYPTVDTTTDDDDDDDTDGPSPGWVALQSQINEVWDAYRNHYYGKHAVGSVYLLDQSTSDQSVDNNNNNPIFHRACFLMQKCVQDDERFAKDGAGWNSVHMVRILPDSETSSSTYQIHSTVRIHMDVTAEQQQQQQQQQQQYSDGGDVVTTTTTTTTPMTQLSGRLFRKVEESHPVPKGDASHIQNIGRMIETIEIDLRSNLEKIHIPKTQDIAQNIRKGVQKAEPPRMIGMPAVPKLPPGAMPMFPKGGKAFPTVGTGRLAGLPRGAHTNQKQKQEEQQQQKANLKKPKPPRMVGVGLPGMGAELNAALMKRRNQTE